MRPARGPPAPGAKQQKEAVSKKVTAINNVKHKNIFAS